MDYLLLVNKVNKLQKNYVPKDLVEVKTIIPGSVQVDRKIYLEKLVAKKWLELKKYVSDLGYNIDISSGYRSYEYQQKLLDNKIEEKGYKEALKIAAIPGTSEHQTGLCLDYEKYYYEDNTLKSDLNESDVEYKIVNEIAHQYGFIIRYPKGKEDITGYKFEPWHLRYVGLKAALKIYKDNITLEEYTHKILIK
ncbi:MAG: M15 family metallopeptidase [Clostridium sp.]|nr:M15 family metallopeptidase [Clostridium sp.]MCM1444392.1 M15 family metallopeptidase [Candidatus Amulumruptor caecigallinarius]